MLPCNPILVGELINCPIAVETAQPGVLLTAKRGMQATSRNFLLRDWRFIFEQVSDRVEYFARAFNSRSLIN
jgi:hypothetical protein